MSAYSWLMGEATAEKSLAKLLDLGAQTLAETIVNDRLNDLISSHDKAGIFGQGGEMLVPYAGWYWRGVNFFGECGVSIAHAGGTVVCENNKWDYDERCLTVDERAEFLRLVWKALQKSREGGSLDSINKATDKALRNAGNFIRSLDVYDTAAIAGGAA